MAFHLRIQELVHVTPQASEAGTARFHPPEVGLLKLGAWAGGTEAIPLNGMIADTYNENILHFPMMLLQWEDQGSQSCIHVFSGAPVTSCRSLGRRAVLPLLPSRGVAFAWS